MTTLLVASTGGHLKQLHRLHRRFATIPGPYKWVTFDTPQSRSLLESEDVTFVPFVGGRDPLNVGRNIRHAHRILSSQGIDVVVSTGSAIALPFFSLATPRRLRRVYIESAARSDGPSLTARIIGTLPGVELFAQYTTWPARKWRYGGSVFDSFAGESASPASGRTIEKVVVTLGTYEGYGFERLLLRLLQILPSTAEVLWQTGDTDVGRLGIVGHRALPEHELVSAMREADAVVAHAGVGSALAAMEVGKFPVLVPRRHAHGEHVDDHQVQIATELAQRGLASSVDADALALSDLLHASAMSVRTVDREPPFAA